MQVVEVLSAAVATVLSGVMMLPQVVRLVRTRVPAGVSATWLGFGVVLNSGWVAYCVEMRLWLVVPLQVSVVAQQAVALGILLPLDRAQQRSALIRAGLLALVCTGVFASAGWTVLGVVLGTSYGIQLGPAVIRAWRSSDLSGISPATWTLSAAESTAWGVFGWAVADGPILIYAAIGTLAAVLVLIRLRSLGQTLRIG
ncbi:MAG: hypothetical protein VX833_02970 [Actinomycetota bacterium]|nr:hypothetical protein [Actinomycetota bacterium]